MNNEIDTKPREAIGALKNLKIILFRTSCSNTDNNFLILEKIIELGLDIIDVEKEQITACYDETKLFVRVNVNKNNSFTLYINDVKEAVMKKNGEIKFMRFNTKRLLSNFENRKNIKKK